MRPLHDPTTGLETGFSFSRLCFFATRMNYGLFTNVHHGTATNDFHVTFTFEDDPQRGTRIHLPGNQGMYVYLAETPALRNAGHYKDDLVYRWKMPHLLARRKVSEGHKSIFIAVFDLFAKSPQITTVKQISAGKDAIALKIHFKDRSDTLLFSPEKAVRIVAEGIHTNGRLGLVCRDAESTRAFLVGGTSFQMGDVRLSCEQGRYTGTIESSMRKQDGDKYNAFIVNADLPTGTALQGQWMIVTHGMEGPIWADTRSDREILQHEVTHGYEIDRVLKANEKTVVILTGDHGLSIEGNTTREVYSQWKVFTGPNRYTILSQKKGLWKD